MVKNPLRGTAAVAVLCAALAACSGAPKEAPTIALPAAPPPGEPPALAGTDAQTLRVAFGEPTFIRKDGTVQMWRYDNTACRAFFFLYPQGNSLIVRHVETVPRGSVMAADESCLAALRTHATTPVS